MQITQIESMIQSLEQDATTLSNVRNLSALYIVQDHLKNATQSVLDSTERELNDILPQYKKYCDIKRQYQLGMIQDSAVHQSLTYVCQEIKEFMQTLYYNTDTQTERTIIQKLLQDLQEAF